MIAIVLELCGIPSLAFAVGVYLPLATSMPVFIGGMVRWLVDSKRRRHPDYAHMTEEEHIAEGDKSPGVLMASGYIAGGAIAGIVIAFMAGILSDSYNALGKWAAAHNPFYAQLSPSQISPDLLADSIRGDRAHALPHRSRSHPQRKKAPLRTLVSCHLMWESEHARRVLCGKNDLQDSPRAYLPRPALPHGVTVAQQTLNLLV